MSSPELPTTSAKCLPRVFLLRTDPYRKSRLPQSYLPTASIVLPLDASSEGSSRHLVGCLELATEIPFRYVLVLHCFKHDYLTAGWAIAAAGHKPGSFDNNDVDTVQGDKASVPSGGMRSRLCSPSHLPCKNRVGRDCQWWFDGCWYRCLSKKDFSAPRIELGTFR